MAPVAIGDDALARDDVEDLTGMVQVGSGPGPASKCTMKTSGPPAKGLVSCWKRATPVKCGR
jgi:hypothetical protein